MLLYLSRNGTLKCSLLYGCVDYRYFINYLINSPRGKVPQICRNMVHFPCGFPVVPLCRTPVVPCSVWTIGGGEKVPPIRGNMVHFPGKKGEMAVESTFSAGKCTKKAGKWFTFPGKKGEIVVESTFSAGKCTKKAGKWFTFPKRRDQRIIPVGSSPGHA